MIQTYKLMSKILKDENKQYSNEELAIKYQQQLDPTILAEIICRNFKLICKVAYNSYFSRLDKVDMESNMVIAVDRALKHYNLDKGKFSTMLVRVLQLEFTNMMSAFKYKGKALNVYSLEQLTENTDDSNYEENFVKEYDDSFDTIELFTSINNSNLTDIEKQVCKIIVTNPRITEEEIGQKLGVNRQRVRKIKFGMQEKLRLILN